MPLLGVAEMNARILNIISATPGEIETGLTKEVKLWLDEARSRAPISEEGSDGLPPGALRDSGEVEPPTKEGFIHSVAITFGKGLPDERAIFAHEDLTAAHPRGGQAKYLESVILEKEAGMSSRIGSEIKFGR